MKARILLIIVYVLTTVASAKVVKLPFLKAGTKVTFEDAKNCQYCAIYYARGHKGAQSTLVCGKD